MKTVIFALVPRLCAPVGTPARTLIAWVRPVIRMYYVTYEPVQVPSPDNNMFSNCFLFVHKFEIETETLVKCFQVFPCGAASEIVKI